MASKLPRKEHDDKHCGEFFDRLSVCKQRDETHNEGKAYTCKYCEKSFNQLTICKQHERTHTGEKPYTCKYCEKSFSQLAHVKEHERTHTGEKPYTCKYCKKSFHKSSHCKQHERTHTAVKYTCKHCEKSFKMLSSYKRHEEKHAIESSLKQKHHDHDHCSELRENRQEPISTHTNKKSGMLFSLSEENLSQVESLTCWICQEECSSKAGLIQHYNDHMR